MARLLSIKSTHATALVESCRPIHNEPLFPLHLAQCLAKGDKMDWVIQKATELGVNHITPLISERSQIRLDQQRREKRLLHWQGVVESACEQCGRARLPMVDAPENLASWAHRFTDQKLLRLALIPGETQRIRDLTLPEQGACIVIGPEGGLGEQDIRALKAAQFTPLAIGPRILRTETAGLAALAAMHACHGDM